MAMQITHRQEVQDRTEPSYFISHVAAIAVGTAAATAYLTIYSANRQSLARPRLVRSRARREDQAGRDAIASVLTHVKARALLRTAHAMRASSLASAMASTL